MAEIIKAAQNFLEVLFTEFGAWNTVFLLVGIYIAFFARRIYLDHRRDKDANRAINAMEISVQRSAQEAREWRMFFFKEKGGLSFEEAERLVSEASFDNPKQARRALEGKKRKKVKKK